MERPLRRLLDRPRRWFASQNKWPPQLRAVGPLSVSARCPTVAWRGAFPTAQAKSKKGRTIALPFAAFGYSIAQEPGPAFFSVSFSAFCFAAASSNGLGCDLSALIAFCCSGVMGGLG